MRATRHLAGAALTLTLIACGGDGGGGSGETCVCACDGSDQIDGDFLLIKGAGTSGDDLALLLSIGGAAGCANDGRPSHFFELTVFDTGFELEPLEAFKTYSDTVNQQDGSYQWPGLQVTMLYQPDGDTTLNLTFFGELERELICEGSGDSISCTEVTST